MKALVNTLHPSPFIGIGYLPPQFLVHRSLRSTIVRVRAPVEKQQRHIKEREREAVPFRWRYCRNHIQIKFKP